MSYFRGSGIIQCPYTVPTSTADKPFLPVGKYLRYIVGVIFRSGVRSYKVLLHVQCHHYYESWSFILQLETHFSHSNYLSLYFVRIWLFYNTVDTRTTCKRA